MDGSLESIVMMFVGNFDSDVLIGQLVQVLIDNGDSVYYGDGKIVKDLVVLVQDWQKFCVEIVIVGVLLVQICIVSNLSVILDNFILLVGGIQIFKVIYIMLLFNCVVNVSWSSSDLSKLMVDECGVV